MNTPEPNLPLLDWQVRDHTEQLKSLRHWRGNTETKLVALDAKIDRLHDAQIDLQKSVDKLARRVAQFTFTLAAGSITFAFTILTATGRL